MKRKALPLMMGLAALLLVMALRVQADPQPILYLDPPETVGVACGETFTLTLRLSEVEDLVGWAVDIEWDPTILEFVKWTEGDCLKYAGKPTTCLYVLEPGKIRDLACVILGFVEGVDIPPAPDDLGTLDFKVKNYTCCTGTWINITFSQLDNSNYPVEPYEIEHTVTNAKFSMCRPPIYSSDLNGTEKNEFLPDDRIYVAIQSCGCEWVTIYVVDDQPYWEPCMTPTDVTHDGPNTVHLDPGRNIIALGTIPKAVPCDYYDIWVDLDNDEHYDECEPVDDIEMLKGFHIIPEVAGTLVGLGACLVALGAFTHRRFRKN